MNNKQEMYVFIIHCSFALLIFKFYITIHMYLLRLFECVI